jgi:hypothetical protein
VDVIPELGGKVYTEYAWFNNTYYWRTPINCSAITNTNIPVILNGTGGLYINGSKQYIWTKCVPTLAVYYNNNDDYVVANDTENIPYEIEAGDKAHIDYSLWADYDLVLHCNNETESTGKWVTGFTGVEFVTNVSKIGNSCYFDGVDNIAIDGSFHLNPSKFSIEMYFNALSVDAGVGLLGKCSSANEKDCEHILTTYAGMHSGIGNGAAPFWATSGSYTINTWWAIINELQIDTTFSLYKNNVFNASASLTGTRKSTSTPLYIGKYLLSAGYDYIGSMDEVRLSNKTYTSGEKTQLYNNYNNFSGYGTPLAEEEQPPCSINVTQNSPPMGGTVFEGNISFNFTGVGTNGTFTCSLIIDNITNSTIYSVVNNTETPIYANLSAGLYDWQINCSIYDTCSDLTGEYRLTVNATTTTTTSTTIPTSSTTTYAPIPSYRTGVNDILWIYAVMLPIMAFISTLAVFYFSSSKIKVNEKVLTDDERYVKDLGREKVTRLLQPILPLISSLLWFSSSYTTINIRFIDNFTVILSPYYIDAGNPEIGMLFTGLGVIMGFYFIFTMLQSAVQSGFIRGDSK